MLTLDDSRLLAGRLDDAPVSVRASRDRQRALRRHEVARRRPAGRFVDYGRGAPTRRAVFEVPPVPSRTHLRARTAVAAALLLTVLVGAVCGLVGLTGADGAAAVPDRTGVVQVRAGETLSSLAARVAPEVPSAAVVQRIVQLNELPGVSIRAGQSLVVPVGG